MCIKKESGCTNTIRIVKLEWINKFIANVVGIVPMH